MLRQNKAFTLIELLVVISVVALLSSVVLASLNSARTKAQIGTAKQQMRSFIQAVAISQGQSSKTLLTMSANGGSTVPNCSICVPSCTGDVRNSVGVCYTNWVAILSGVQSNSNGVILNLTSMTRDPWGSPYFVDENQGESNCTTADALKSVGPDGTNGTSDDIPSPIPVPLSGTCP